MSENGQSQMDRAKEYILAHPDESKKQQASALGVSTMTVARARRDLVLEGKLPASRKAKEPPKPPVEGESTPPPIKSDALKDQRAMETLSRMLDEMENLDDAEVHKRLLKQCIRFAFDPNLHADTRMSASQMWSKLKDQQKAKDIGPSAQMQFDDAVIRLSDLMRATGAKITLAAVNMAFDEGGLDEGQLPAVPSTPA